eukprot:SAG11_NODE_36083_length_263_cov_0.939024_1_plen_52_part_10
MVSIGHSTHLVLPDSAFGMNPGGQSEQDTLRISILYLPQPQSWQATLSPRAS